jgi:putative phosphoribosyl transferase
MKYVNRQDAGKRLGKVLRHKRGSGVIVLALPRGGVIVAAEVAKEINAPLGLVLVRKIGHPNFPEYAIGAIAEGQKPVYDKSQSVVLDKKWLANAEKAARKVIDQRRQLYYGKDFIPPEISGKSVILVDDGIATGLTMDAAILAVRANKAKRITIAVPVAPQDSLDGLEAIADEVIVLDDPKNFLWAVGSHYLEFEPVEDDEVRALLREMNGKD